MSDSATAARPYARAVFELARDGGDFGAWSEALSKLAELAEMPQVQVLFAQPALDRQKVAELVSDAIKNDNESVRNFVRLLSENRRLTLLPAISEAFDSLRRGHEQRAEVTVTTAAEVDTSHRDALTSAVERHLGRKADIHWEVDEALLAGARIRAGDQIIDASAVSQLEQLRFALTA